MAPRDDPLRMEPDKSMAHNSLPDSEVTAPAAEPQEAPKKASIQAPVNQAVYDEIARGLKREGLGSVSNGTKLVLLAFVRSKAMRRTFRHALALVTAGVPSVTPGAPDVPPAQETPTTKERAS